MRREGVLRRGEEKVHGNGRGGVNISEREDWMAEVCAI